MRKPNVRCPALKCAGSFGAAFRIAAYPGALSRASPNRIFRECPVQGAGGSTYTRNQKPLQRSRRATCFNVETVFDVVFVFACMNPSEVWKIVDVALRTTNHESRRDQSALARLASNLFKH